MSASRVCNFRVRAAVAAAVLGTASQFIYIPQALAADAAPEEKITELEEVRVTGSRIVRKDTQSNSPLVTVDRERLQENSYISIEQALNELPQFMAGGAGLGSTASGGVGQLVGQEGLDGGAGSGTMFDNARLPDNGGRVGTFTPGAANVNLRGLGTNRSLTLIDGHRGQPNNATGTVDLNTIPSAAIASVEVVTGGASAVYGADALAGVTNIKLRDNFEGISVSMRGGIYEVGDGGEYQVSTVMGTSLKGKGNAMVGIEYSKRDTAYVRQPQLVRRSAGIPLFQLPELFLPAVLGIPRERAGRAQPGGSERGVLRSQLPEPERRHRELHLGDRACRRRLHDQSQRHRELCESAGACDPLRRCDAVHAIGELPVGEHRCRVHLPGPDTGNDLLLRTAGLCGRHDQHAQQSVRSRLHVSRELPEHGVSGPQLRAFGHQVRLGPLAEQPARGLQPVRSRQVRVQRPPARVLDHQLRDFDRPRRAARSRPLRALSRANIPYNSSPTAIYLPSVQPDQRGRAYAQRCADVVLAAGATLPEYVSIAAGGTNTRGTNCPATGGCTMVQAFPVPTELRTLAELANRRNAGCGRYGGHQSLRGSFVVRELPAQSEPCWHGRRTGVRESGHRRCRDLPGRSGHRSACCIPAAPMPHGRTTTPSTSSRRAAPSTRSAPGAWRRAWKAICPSRTGPGTSTPRWVRALTQTEFQGFVSLFNYRTILSQPNYGKGYQVNTAVGKTLSCTSGLSPFSPEPITQDCIDAVASNQTDRQRTNQRVHEFTMQGGLFELPAGEVRGALGVSYRKNTFVYTPDSLRESDYINDTSPGQFGVGSVDAGVSVKEVYSELLVPLLRDLPGIQSLELELGGRWSEYSTGQNVPTWKALVSWQPVELDPCPRWLQPRGACCPISPSCTPRIRSMPMAAWLIPAWCRVRRRLPARSMAPARRRWQP